MAATLLHHTSSSRLQGWRIDGLRIASGNGGETSSIDTKLMRTDSELRHAIEAFLQRRRAVHASCLARLRALVAALEVSEEYRPLLDHLDLTWMP